MSTLQTKIFMALFCASMLTFSGSLIAADVYIDYDHSLDLNKYKTFQMADVSKGALAQSSPLMNQRIHDMIVQHLTGMGMTEVKENPDQTITYDASTKENHVLNTVGAPMGPVGIGFRGGWGRFGGMGMATTTVSTFTEGTLVVDAYTVPGKQIIWRGIAEASVSENPEKTTKNVTKSLDKMFEKLAKVMAQ